MRDTSEQYPDIFRPLKVIAREIQDDYPKAAEYPLWNYLHAMMDMEQVNHMYGMEYGDLVLAHILDLISHWHGENARAIKLELHEHLDWYNKCGNWA